MNVESKNAGQIGQTQQRKLLGLALCLSLLNTLSIPFAAAQTQLPRLSGDVSMTVAPTRLNETLPIPGASKTVTMSFHGVALADALRALARQGGFNVMVDDSVQGGINTDLNNVRIQDALETLRTAGNLAYAVQGGTLVVAKADSPRGKTFRKSSTRIFPLKNANAMVMANFLNQTLFGDRMPAGGGSAGGSSTGGSQSGMTVTPDPQTNSLIVIGTPSDINNVQKHIAELDQPRHMRTWRLSHANVFDAATILASSLFNEGQPAIILGNSGGSSGGAGGGGGSTGGGSNTGPGNMPSSLRLTTESLTEGSGAGQIGQSQGGGGGGGGGGSSGGSASQVMGNNSITLRAKLKQSQTVQVSPNGPILIPDTRLNALTLLGTAEQIEAMEAFLPTIDRKVPQVVLEASLVEISDTGRRELGFSYGASQGIFSGGSNNIGGLAPYSNRIGLGNSTSTPLENVIRFSTNPLTRTRDFVYQVNALVSNNKAKMLANPSVITTSDNETMISIVDEIIKSVSITVGTNTGIGGGISNNTTATTNIGEAGIVLNILPRVGADGTINLRVRPVVSTVSGIQQDRYGNIITLVSKREVLAQNSVLHDGETFVLGGLLQDTNSKAVSSTPLLANLPILGALARNSTNAKNRTELVLLITPHIVSDDSAPPIQTSSARYIKPATVAGSPVNNGMIPVSLSQTNAAKSHGILPDLQSTPVMFSEGNVYRKESAREQMSSQAMTPTPRLQTQPTHPQEAPARPSSYGPPVSDAEVQAILNRYK